MRHKILGTLLLLGTCFAQGLCNEVDKYVDFLYQCMPLPDSLDYSREYFAKNVETSLAARSQMPWGKAVPEREFRYFVLPVRVNNENLDDSRMVFFNELKDRVKDKTMEQAALEVNHWCHEKANYRPSDGRTSSPLATVKTSWGRCGEESTFAVAAMRSVGIPARQVYTPRWAHTDDNHAWVEVWIDGKWHFLGACEPEPRLDMAWFTPPAGRALLMHTTILGGDYDGPEEVIARGPASTEINVTSGYAPTETYTVKVLNEDGTPAKDAKVRFTIYNYAEFYPAVTKTTDENGQASLLAGLGDMVVWASDGKKFGFGKHTPGQELTIVLDKDNNYEGNFDITIVPPRPSASLAMASDEETQINARRFAYEDSLRNVYMGTFMTEYSDNPRFSPFMAKSYGNWVTIKKFIDDKKASERCFNLLSSISDKDLRDITRQVLDDAYDNSLSDDLFVLSPRFAHEMLTPYKSFFQNKVFSSLGKLSPSQWKEWVQDNINVDPEARFNPKRLYISPMGVWNHRKDIDSRSRDVFFTAGARSLGIPAQIDPVTDQIKWKIDGKDWDVVTFNDQSKPQEVQNLKPGQVKITCSENPEYYSQFSISKIVDGFPRLLNYDEMVNLSALTDSNGMLTLDEGQYILTAGRRKPDGSVASTSHIFHVPGMVSFAIPHDQWEVQPINRINHDLLGGFGNKLFTILSIMRHGHEPSTHAYNDITPFTKQLEDQGAQVHLLYAEQCSPKLLEALEFTEPEAPVVVLVGADGKVYFRSTGYQIGLGKTLSGLMTNLTH